MDFEKIKNIKNNYDMIKKFRFLEKYKDLSKDKFKIEMEKILPKFAKENAPIFELIIEGKDLHFLDLMFHKLDEINKEFKERESEIDIIEPTVEDIRSLIKMNPDISKNKIISHLKINSPDFCNKYPLIIDNLMDKDNINMSVSNLLFLQIKFSHEKIIGEMLANQYINLKK